jgi:membrane associated rhomboid family serine protease
MFRKTSGAILCPSCGRITNADAAVCLTCGFRRPGLWGFGGALGRLVGSLDVTKTISMVCGGLYVLSLVIEPGAALQARGPLELLAPSGRALLRLGATGAFAWEAGRWWTLITAIYLHGGLLHILVNVLWIRQLGPAVEELFGPARLATIFTLAGAAGFAYSTYAGVPLTIGASGSICGLLGAMVAYGRQRGGVFGAQVLRQYGIWALVLVIFGFLVPGVDNHAHAGGFVGGFLAATLLGARERRREVGLDHLLALGAIMLTALAFALALAQGFLVR